MRFLTLGAASVFLAGCATTTGTDDGMMAADNDAPIVVEQGQEGRPENDDVICRIEAPTGTRMRERVCRTRAEWEEIQEAGREALRHRQSTGYSRY